jgi:hypothetical protein
MRFESSGSQRRFIHVLAWAVSGVLAVMCTGCASQTDPARGSELAGQLAPAPADDIPSDCPSEYTTAVRTIINLRWTGTLGVAPGTGQLLVWAKLKYPQGNAVMAEVTLCALQVPPLTRTLVLGSAKSAVDIPTAAFDAPTMPKFTGTLRRNGRMFEFVLNPSLIGLTLSDPSGAWPAVAADIMAVDHDGDGKPGVTAVAKQGDGFSQPPINVAQTQLADEMYVAARVQYRATGVIADCADVMDGKAELLAFDYAVVGCHVKDAGDCSNENVQLVQGNRPKLVAAGAGSSYTTRLIPNDATCADVRAALPVP